MTLVVEHLEWPINHFLRLFGNVRRRPPRATGTGSLPMRERTLLRMPAFRSAGFAAVLALVALADPALAMPATGSDTVKGLYDTLLNTMKNGHILGQSGRFVQLEPVISRSFDVAAMARLSVGSSWAGLTEPQRQQMTESYGRCIPAIYAERFDR